MTRNKKRKHDRILILAKSKLNSIETSISQILIDMDISHEEFITILKEKGKYEKMKDNLRSENEKYNEMVSNDTSYKATRNYEIEQCEIKDLKNKNKKQKIKNKKNKK